MPKTFSPFRRFAVADRPRLHRRADRRHGHGQPLQGVPRRLLAEPQGRRLPRPRSCGTRPPRRSIRTTTSAASASTATSAGGQNATGRRALPPRLLQGRRGGVRLPRQPHGQGLAGTSSGWATRSARSTPPARTSTTPPALRGKLLLIVGEMDTNVPPESTLRLADALIKAGKDFDFAGGARTRATAWAAPTARGGCRTSSSATCKGRSRRTGTSPVRGEDGSYRPHSSRSGRSRER